MDNIFVYESNSYPYKSEKSLIDFTIKVVLLIIPGIFLGIYTERLVKYIQQKNNMSNLITFIIQLAIMIITLYLIMKFNGGYAYEFQNTISGLFFAFVYFGTQSNFLTVIQNLF